MGAALACAFLSCAGLFGLACERAESMRPAPSGSDLAGGGLEGANADLPVVLFLGTSITAGYGLPAELAFPALIQERIDAAGLHYRVVNAGVSGDTSAGGLARIDWLLQLPVAVLVLELGANDMLRGQDIDVLCSNLQQILDRTRAAYPDARLVVAGMRAPPNLGARYVADFEAVYPALARENDAVLVPFVLEGVAGHARLNQADGIHPTAEGQRVVAQTIWQALEPVLRAQRRRGAGAG